MIQVVQPCLIQSDKQLFVYIQIHLGGIDSFLQPGKRLQVRSNFTGCMENVWFDSMNIIKDARKGQPRFALHGDMFLQECRVSVISHSPHLNLSHIWTLAQTKTVFYKKQFTIVNYSPSLTVVVILVVCGNAIVC